MHMLPVIGLVCGLMGLLAGFTIGAFASDRREHHTALWMIAGAVVAVAINVALLFVVEGGL